MKSANKDSTKPIKILIVEDSHTQALQLKKTLQLHNYEVIMVNNGTDALQYLKHNHPSIIISDIIMPNMDGYCLCKKIKQSKKHKDIPVILLTQLSDPKDIIKGLVCGADHFITKRHSNILLCLRHDCNNHLLLRNDINLLADCLAGIGIDHVHVPLHSILVGDESSNFRLLRNRH